jgi:Cu/Ag efflux protein CusF
MTMEFKVANGSLLQDLKVGAPVSFEFVEHHAGDWVITSIKSAAAKTAATSGR